MCVKKGAILNLAYFKVNLILIPKYTWWIDFSATTHISVFMQSCLSYQKLIDGKRYIYVDDGNIVEVKEIRTSKLLLKIEFYLDLNKTYIVPSFR